MKQERYLILDEIRGFTLLNMFFYHGIWDLVYLFGLVPLRRNLALATGDLLDLHPPLGILYASGKT